MLNQIPNERVIFPPALLRFRGLSLKGLFCFNKLSKILLNKTKHVEAGLGAVKGVWMLLTSVLHF